MFGNAVRLGLQIHCRAIARPPSRDTLQVRPCSSYAASVPRKVSRRWAGKDQSSSSCAPIAMQQPESRVTRCPRSSIKRPFNFLVRCPCRLRDRWRHGCRHRAPWMGSRRVPRVARAPRARPARL
ncbi:hypothetical protein XmelCFBP4644_04715 [Xanthomonas melonis]|uniref:Uncharacterized protein n=1 Tax=Xanthomonas melonis TaxID=56456 RepID=A0A2S7DIX6_9XANT|nr:hypothetical protein XmelCFBP4644_04715 [Xanthomonas melonis]